VDQRLDGRIRVTVIATGFEVEGATETAATRTEKAEQDGRGNQEYITLDMWNSITRPAARQDDLFSDVDDDPRELGVPAVLRRRRAFGSR